MRQFSHHFSRIIISEASVRDKMTEEEETKGLNLVQQQYRDCEKFYSKVKKLGLFLHKYGFSGNRSFERQNKDDEYRQSAAEERNATDDQGVEGADQSSGDRSKKSISEQG